jgi:hypothetical protein
VPEPTFVPSRPVAAFASLEAALTIIGRTPAVLRGLVDALDAPLLEAGSRPDGGANGGRGWGPRQVAEHLLDVEDIAFMDRLRRVVDGGVSGELPYIRSIDPPARLVEGGYAARSLEDLLAGLEQRRDRDVAWLRSLPAEALDSQGEHDRAGMFAVRDLIHYWACHDLLHLRQVVRGLQDSLAPFAGNLTMFFEEV